MPPVPEMDRRHFTIILRRVSVWAPCYFVLRRSLKTQPSRPDGQLLGQEFERFKFVVQTVQLAAEDFFVVALLFLQRGDLGDPALQNGRACAAALDEVVGALLVVRDLLFDRRIELLRHLVALLGVVDDVEAVRRQEGIVFVEPVDGVDEARRRMEKK